MPFILKSLNVTINAVVNVNEKVYHLTFNFFTIMTVFSEQYIGNICIFGSNGDGITTSGTIADVKYEEFVQSEMANQLTALGQKVSGYLISNVLLI